MSSPIKKHGPLKCSTFTPQGLSIKCVCDNVFAVVEIGEPAECPECKRKFEPGFAVKATVLSKYSGMPVGVFAGAETAVTPDEAVLKAAARLYDPEMLDKLICKLDESEPAFFDCAPAGGAF